MSTGVYTKTFGQVCRDALRDSGIVAVERPITAPHFTLAQSKANDVLVEWQGKGIHLWLETEALLPLIAGQNEYSLGPNGDHCFTDYSYTTTSAAVTTSNILSVASTTGMVIGYNIGVMTTSGVRTWSTISSVGSGAVTLADSVTADSGASIYVYQNKIDRPIRILSGRGATDYLGDEKDLDEITREVYFNTVNKRDRSSDIQQFYYSPQLTNGKLYVWQTPASGDQVLRFTFVKPQYVNEDQTENVLIPSEWFLAFKWAIAYQLGVTYAIDPNRLITIAQAAQISFDNASSNDEEFDSFMFGPSNG